MVSTLQVTRGRVIALAYLRGAYQIREGLLHWRNGSTPTDVPRPLLEITGSRR